MKQYDVIIVGLGPTGGTLANLLAIKWFFNSNFRNEKKFVCTAKSGPF